MSDKLKVAVLGCGGIIGQHLMVSVPEGVEPLFVRKHPFPLSVALDLEDWEATKEWLDSERPDVIVNLAGESRPDVVERDNDTSHFLNVNVPEFIGGWCDRAGSHLIHVSSQAVFSGGSGPYTPDSLPRFAPNRYGQQKAMADHALKCICSEYTIVRPTFVLGIRPFPALGRENPAEAILGGKQTLQVDNRWFSVSFAWDVAAMLWKMAQLRPKGKIVHCGNPERLSRYQLACILNPQGQFEPISHEELCKRTPLALAERPLDTTFKDAYFETPLEDGLQELRAMYRLRTADALPYRALELAAFLKRPAEEVRDKLMLGFGPLHNAVTDDFKCFMKALPDADFPQTDLLDWYRITEAYLWELTAYHTDSGFNYAGTCEGVITRLKHDLNEVAERGPKHPCPECNGKLKQCVYCGGRLQVPVTYRIPYRVLCLGDGVGTLTIKMKEAGFEPVYHDLMDSRTAAFAEARFAMRFTDRLSVSLTAGFEPISFIAPVDAIVSLDYLEHLPCVDDWVRMVFAKLKPGGIFFAQNAFNCGSGPNGAIPQHLACNDHWEVDWDPFLSSLGFTQESSNIYRKPL